MAALRIWLRAAHKQRRLHFGFEDRRAWLQTERADNPMALLITPSGSWHGGFCLIRLEAADS